MLLGLSKSWISQILLEVYMSVLFSIAVHENQDCVHDMIENILWFCPESTIILHIAKGFDFTLEPKFNASVHINKLQYYTGFIDGTLVYVHLSNYRYATRINLNFSTFVPFGSNQMFIKKGFESYVNNFDLCRISQLYEPK